ncbi:hypothetical protein MTR_3g067485 [Medicago truncatula]|uniref:Uncharacterized protein n=1 Tax=Medicago truncatula TaxID=3880 RepID=A0A072V8Y6_MEDTR|nr:hypothetical protein MTR_3g067485 [Medicago truncatula]
MRYINNNGEAPRTRRAKVNHRSKYTRTSGSGSVYNDSAWRSASIEIMIGD